MIARIYDSARRFVERIESGEISLITDERWLPVPLADDVNRRVPIARASATTGQRRRIL